MNYRFLVLMGVLAAGIGVVTALAPTVNAQTSTASSWSSPRTPWGHPDLQGRWTNTTTTLLERPKELEGKQFFTDEEFAEQDRRRAEQRDNDRRGRVGTGDVGAYNEFWVEPGRLNKRTSLLVDPPDGRLPPLTPEGQKRRAEQAEASKTRPADGPEDRNPFERCITRGLPGAMMPGFYNHNYHILQTPGYVAILVEMMHDARIIPLDGRPHVGQNIRQWLGDSRGRWEGNTLVVETTNLNEIHGFGTGETGRVIERFTRVDADSIDYQVTVDDPSTYTRSWTAAIPMTKLEGALYEYACHEGNYSMPLLLSGHRAAEQAAGGR